MRCMGAAPTIRALLVAAAMGAGANALPADVADPVAVAERAMAAERASWGAPDATVAQRLASAGRLLEIRPGSRASSTFRRRSNGRNTRQSGR